MNEGLAVKMTDACLNGNLDEVKQIISAGFDVNSILDEDYVRYTKEYDIDNPTPLMLACVKHNKELVQLLCDNGAEAEDCIEICAFTGRFNDVLEILIQYGKISEKAVFYATKFGGQDTLNIITKESESTAVKYYGGESMDRILKECGYDPLI